MPVSSLKHEIKGVLRPLGKRLFVRRIPEPTKAGPLILPGNMAHVDLARGTIVAVGSKVPVEDELESGDIVRYPPQLGYVKFIQQGVELELVPLEQIKCVER